jgi:hypothetical protein
MYLEKIFRESCSRVPNLMGLGDFFQAMLKLCKILPKKYELSKWELFEQFIRKIIRAMETA